MSKKKYFHIWIDEDLHAEFKSKVALEKSNMAEVLEQLIIKYLESKDETKNL